MSKKLYIGNLPFSINNDKLKVLFSAYSVENAEVVLYRDGRSKGFGFITVKDEFAEKTKTEMNGKEIEGRQITVNDAVPFDPNRPRKSFDEVRKHKQERRFDRSEKKDNYQEDKDDYQEGY